MSEKTHVLSLHISHENYGNMKQLIADSKRKNKTFNDIIARAICCGAIFKKDSSCFDKDDNSELVASLTDKAIQTIYRAADRLYKEDVAWRFSKTLNRLIEAYIFTQRFDHKKPQYKPRVKDVEILTSVRVDDALKEYNSTYDSNETIEKLIRSALKKPRIIKEHKELFLCPIWRAEKRELCPKEWRKTSVRLNGHHQDTLNDLYTIFFEGQEKNKEQLLNELFEALTLGQIKYLTEFQIFFRDCVHFV